MNLNITKCLIAGYHNCLGNAITQRKHNGFFSRIARLNERIDDRINRKQRKIDYKQAELEKLKASLQAELNG